VVVFSIGLVKKMTVPAEIRMPGHVEGETFAEHERRGDEWFYGNARIRELDWQASEWMELGFIAGAIGAAWVGYRRLRVRTVGGRALGDLGAPGAENQHH
jgi:hypothetical protein